MKRISNISLGSMSFPLEEDAYARLDAYLAAIRARFGDAGTADEIVGDIEMRAAERFGAKNGAVITLVDVEALIAAMGSPEELGDEAGPEAEAGARPAPGRRRRLFRNPADGIVAGVASGLAAWLGMETVWVRTALVASVALTILTPINVFGIIALVGYVILWIVLPVARTESEKMEMRGEAVTLRSLEAALKERVDSIRAEDRGTRAARAGKRGTAAADRLSRFVGAVASWFFRIFGIALAALGIGIIVVALTVALNLVFNTGNTDLRVFSPSIRLSELLVGWKLAAASVGGFLTVAIPATFLFLLGLSLAARRNRFRQYLSFALIGVWIVSVAAVATAGIRTGREVAERMASDPGQQEMEQVLNIQDQGIASVAVADGYRVEISRGDTFSVRSYGRTGRLNALDVKVTDGVLAVTEREGASEDGANMCLFCAIRNARVEITMPRLDGVSATDGSDLTVQGFDSPTLAISAQDGSRVWASVDAAELSASAAEGSSIDLEGTIGRIRVNASAGSRIDVVDARIDDVEAEATMGSDLSFGSVKQLDVKATSGASVTYDAAEDVDPDVSGGASVRQNGTSEEYR